jgi:predicted AlkP superfamily phosphohydrolase/phosphomutase
MGLSKLILFGLDGEEFATLRRMVAEAPMPTLGGMLAEAASGPLESTDPPVTLPAWPSYFTGQNPGKHGVVSFFEDLEGGQTRIVDLTDVRVPKLWDLLGQGGLRCGVFNIPLTFPAEPTSGFMVSGFPSVNDPARYLYLPGFEDAFIKAFPDYSCGLVTLVDNRGKTPDEQLAIARTLADYNDMRCRALESLVAWTNPDALLLCFQFPDKMKHLLWRETRPDSGPSANGRNEEVLALVRESYARIDRTLAHLKAWAGPDANFLFMSDHGFGHVHTLFCVNNYLAKKGFFRPPRLAVMLDIFLRLTRRLARGPLERVHRWLHLPTSLYHSRLRNWLVGSIDAQCARFLEYGVRINVNGRTLKGRSDRAAYETLRDHIRRALAEAVDPRTGRCLLESVWTREELYTGPFVERFPDLIYRPAPGIYVTDALLPRILLREGCLRDAAGFADSWHERDGIFIGFGPAFRKKAQVRASLLDLAPTALYLADLPIPSNMDGRVIAEALKPELLESRPPRYAEAPADTSQTSRQGAAYSAKDQKAIERRLADLGYL